jgi:tetratricopeptide (TPR) repeat protein
LATLLLMRSFNTAGLELSAHEKTSLDGFRGAIYAKLNDNPNLERLRLEVRADQISDDVLKELMAALEQAAASDTHFHLTLNDFMADLQRLAGAGSATPPQPIVHDVEPTEAQLRDLEDRANGRSLSAALRASEQLVGVLTAAVGHSPAVYAARLASALKVHGHNIASAEGPAEAVGAFTESVHIFRQLANDHDALSLLQLAQALEALSLTYTHPNDSYAALREAYDVCQRLARLEPVASASIYASISLRLGGTCVSLGNYHSASKYAAEAETRLWSLAEMDPDYLPDLAATLRLLSTCSLEADDVGAAERDLGRAHEILGKLAARTPDPYQSELDHVTRTLAAIRGEPQT